MIRTINFIYLAIAAVLMFGDCAFAVQMNPYFNKMIDKPPPVPIIKQIKKQLAQGCSSPKKGLRPLGDNYALRHDLGLSVGNSFQRVASATVVGDIPFAKAVNWMTPYLQGKNKNEAIMGYLFLLTHSGRKIAEGAKIDNSKLIASGKIFAKEILFNLSDFYFHEALQAFLHHKLKKAGRLARNAIRADPVFYNAHLLLLDIELAEFARSSARDAKYCQRSIERIFQTTVDLGGLDTCPRHAVLMDEWVRSKYRSQQVQLPLQIINAYVSVLTNTSGRIKHIEQNLLKGQIRQSPKCKGLALQRIRQMGTLQ